MSERAEYVHMVVGRRGCLHEGNEVAQHLRRAEAPAVGADVVAEGAGPLSAVAAAATADAADAADTADAADAADAAADATQLQRGVVLCDGAASTMRVGRKRGAAGASAATATATAAAAPTAPTAPAPATGQRRACLGRLGPHRRPVPRRRRHRDVLQRAPERWAPLHARLHHAVEADGLERRHRHAPRGVLEAQPGDGLALVVWFGLVGCNNE